MRKIRAVLQSDYIPTITNLPPMKKRTLYLYKLTEWRILLAGILLSTLLIAVIGYYMISDPLMSRTLILVFVAHTFGGRAAGIGLCIIDGLNPLVSILYNFYIEILIVFWTYSLFVLSISNYIGLRFLRLYALKLERKARKHKVKVASYGWIGLFIFVMLPLPATGPVMGSIIGYLTKMSLWRNFSSVFMGTFTAIVIWFVFFDFLEQHLHIIRFIFVAIIAIVKKRAMISNQLFIRPSLLQPIIRQK